MIRTRLIPLAGLLCLGACAGKEAPGQEAGVAATRVPVGVGLVARDTMVETLTLAGRLSPRPGGAILLSAPASGVVRSLAVQLGDRVERGRQVAALDVPELAGDAQARESAAVQAEREAERQQQLLADGIASARQAEEAAAAARQARAAADAAHLLLARTRISSPLSGAVAEVLVQRGEQVDAGRPLLRIVAADTLDLIAPVPAAELGRLHPGLPAEVRQDGDTVPVRGRLAALAPAVDSLTNTGSAVIRVPNPAHRLRPGAAATARVRIGTHPDVLSVPDSAVVLAGDSAAVFVIGPDSLAHLTLVRRGARVGGRTEVEGELQPGNRVVTTGAFGLQDGMRVVPAAADPASHP